MEMITPHLNAMMLCFPRRSVSISSLIPRNMTWSTNNHRSLTSKSSQLRCQYQRSHDESQNELPSVHQLQACIHHRAFSHQTWVPWPATTHCQFRTLGSHDEWTPWSRIRWKLWTRNPTPAKRSHIHPLGKRYASTIAASTTASFQNQFQSTRSLYPAQWCRETFTSTRNQTSTWAKTK